MSPPGCVLSARASSPVHSGEVGATTAPTFTQKPSPALQPPAAVGTAAWPCPPLSASDHLQAKGVLVTSQLGTSTSAPPPQDRFRRL